MQKDWVICPNGCGEKVFHLELTSHCLTICRDRLEHCAYGCGELVKYRERDRHKMLFCAHRFVPCKYAPECKWTGLAKHLPIHIDDIMTIHEKQAVVPDDPHIECLERPFVCWHPPLIPSAETFVSLGADGHKSYEVEWVGCGASVRFGDRVKHITESCPFRVITCEACGTDVKGAEFQEHLSGKAMNKCQDTLVWLQSGCTMREVSCYYIVSKPAGSTSDAAAEGGKHAAKHRTRAPGKQHIGTRSKRRPRQVSPENSGHSGSEKESQPHSTSQAHSEGEADESPDALKIIVEKGCSKRMAAKDLLDHQEHECTDRFVYCRLGCGAFLKWRDQGAHEDETHLLQTDLHLAAEDGDLERVKDHVEGRDNARKHAVNCRDEIGNNALHYAIAGNHDELARYLIAARVDPDVPGAHGRTPLMLCAAGGNMPILQQLLRMAGGAVKLDAQDDIFGWTALHLAAFAGNHAAADALLAAKAAVNIPDRRRGDTPLHIAMVAGHEAIARRLADGGADLGATTARRCKTFYHTFSQDTGKPRAVRRGDLPHDLARTEEMKAYTRPEWDDRLAGVRLAETLDPRYGITFETAAAARRPSPIKERALGRSPSPPPAARSSSPAAAALHGSATSLSPQSRAAEDDEEAAAGGGVGEGGGRSKSNSPVTARGDD